MMLESPKQSWSHFHGSDNEMKMEMLRELCEYGFHIDATPRGLEIHGRVQIIIPTKDADDVEFRVTA